MKKEITTNLTEIEFRRIIREEVAAALADNHEALHAPFKLPFIDITEAAEVLKLKKSYIYLLVGKKEIPFHKSGRRLLFKRSELDEWMLRKE